MDRIPARLPGSEPFSHNSSGTGVVLCHGFPATPHSMVPWGRYLADQGFSVRVPLLRGYGTTWRELNATTWPQWMESLEEAYLELSRSCDRVYAFGLSMGGLMVTRLALEHPTIAGLSLVNPLFRHSDPRLRALPVISRVVPYLPAKVADIKLADAPEVALRQMPLRALNSLTHLMREVDPRLSELTLPVQVFRSREDHVIPLLSVDHFKERAVNAQVEEIWLEDSYHVATLDNDAPLIFERSVEFIRGLDGAG